MAGLSIDAGAGANYSHSHISVEATDLEAGLPLLLDLGSLCCLDSGSPISGSDSFLVPVWLEHPQPPHKQTPGGKLQCPNRAAVT